MNKIDYRAILHRLKLLCIMSLFVITGLKIIGIEAFTAEIKSEVVLDFINFVDNNLMVRAVINVIKSVLILNIMFAVVVRSYKENVKELNVIFLIYSVIINMAVPGTIRFILNFAIYFLPYKYTKNVLLCVYLLITDSIFGGVSSCLLSLNPIDRTTNYLVLLIIMSDWTLYWLLHLIDKKLGGAKWVTCLELDQVFLTKKLTNPSELLTTLKHACRKLLVSMIEVMFKLLSMLKKLSLQCLKLNWQNVRLKIKYDLPINFKHRILPLLIIFGIYIGYAHVIGRVSEAVILYIAYLSFYHMLPKHFHADYIPHIKQEHVTITCVCLSSLVFCVMLFNATMFSFSVFFTIIVALVFDLLLYYARDYLDLTVFYLKNISFKVKNCSKEDLISRCREKGYNLQETEVAIWMFVDKLSLMEIAEKLNIEMQSANNRKSKMKKKLES